MFLALRKPSRQNWSPAPVVFGGSHVGSPPTGLASTHNVCLPVQESCDSFSSHLIDGSSVFFALHWSRYAVIMKVINCSILQQRYALCVKVSLSSEQENLLDWRTVFCVHVHLLSCPGIPKGVLNTGVLLYLSQYVTHVGGNKFSTCQRIVLHRMNKLTAQSYQDVPTVACMFHCWVGSYEAAIKRPLTALAARVPAGSPSCLPPHAGRPTKIHWSRWGKPAQGMKWGRVGRTGQGGAWKSLGWLVAHTDSLHRPHPPSWVNPDLYQRLSWPITAAGPNPGERGQMCLYPKETSSSPNSPAGYSGVCAATAWLHGEDWPDSFKASLSLNLAAGAGKRTSCLKPYSHNQNLPNRVPTGQHSFIFVFNNLLNKDDLESGESVFGSLHLCCFLFSECSIALQRFVLRMKRIGYVLDQGFFQVGVAHTQLQPHCVHPKCSLPTDWC